MSIKLPESSRNMISLSGALLTIIGACVFWAMFFLADFGLISSSSYLGLVLYMILPVPIVIGLLLIPLGMYLNRSRAMQKLYKAPLPVIDLNNLRHRNAAAIFSFGSIFVGFFIFFVSYQGFHYTESTEFCGQLCHTIMKPEYTTYAKSPHARVPCVSCHVGKGAGWYARSKLSGLYQVYATLFDKYPRPIETPITNLRPARETCEECHWPEKLFPARERKFNHYIEEEDNALWQIGMRVEIGGQSPDYKKHPGSHWHVHPDVKVEYIAVDEKRLEIPWIRLTYLHTGEQMVFQSEDNPLDNAELEHYEIRTMDCIDCHNRPSHIFKSPDEALNDMMFNGAVPPGLPEIKTVGIELLSAEYASLDSAGSAFREGIRGYYTENYPRIAQNRSAEIENAVRAMTEYYAQNFFFHMKSRWDIYPVHLGHMYSPGCFRCHDNMHVSSAGQTITNNCNSCHEITYQGDEYASWKSSGLDFRHPVDIDEAWKEIPCYECHSPENR